MVQLGGEVLGIGQVLGSSVGEAMADRQSPLNLQQLLFCAGCEEKEKDNIQKLGMTPCQALDAGFVVSFG